MKRRDFVKNSIVAGAGLSMTGNPLFRLGKHRTKEKVVVALAGIRSRGRQLASNFVKLPGCEIKYLVDVDERYFETVLEDLKDMSENKPITIKDFRVALDDRDVDALVIATPDHWHAPMSIEAVKAGKHVYVEKPCSHNPAEGELLVEAFKKYGRLIQMGAQRRSTTLAHLMKKEIDEGIIGNPYLVNTWYANQRPPIGFGKEAPVPPALDWELWQGPAPRKPYRDNLHPYNWHWFWHWGTGEALNNGTHELDVARWMLGLDFPVKVSSVGGRFHYVGEDDWECPDTQTISLEFKEGKMITWEGRSCNRHPDFGTGRGVAIYGSGGTIIYKDSVYEVYSLNDELVKKVDTESAAKQVEGLNTVDPGLGDRHAENFLEAIRGKEELTLPIDEGYKSVLLGLLGNISLRTGRILNTDPSNGHILDDPEAAGLWHREYQPGWEPEV